MIGRRMKQGAALLLALLLILAAAQGALFSARAETILPARAEAGLAAAEGGSDSSPGGVRIARSRKKKTATPTPVSPPSGDVTPTPVPEGPIIDPQSIADYLFAHGELPENFITKKEAQALGWDSRFNYVSDVAPGMSIGGDYFGNYEGKLPRAWGLTYREADCWYTGGSRNAFRIIYSSDGRVWYTEDHYNTFTELFPTVPSGR